MLVHVSWQDFDASRLAVSLSISLFSTLENLKKLFTLDIFSIVFILGWSLYFWIDFKTGSLITLERGSDTGYSGILRWLMMVEEKVFKTLAVLLSVLMNLSFSIKIIFSSDRVLSERKGLTVFQKVLLSMIFFSFKLL